MRGGHPRSIAALAFAVAACGNSGSGGAGGTGGSGGVIEGPSGTLVGDPVDRPGADARVSAPCGWLGVGWQAGGLQYSPDGSMLAILNGRYVTFLRASDWAPLHAVPPLAIDTVDFAFTAGDTITISAALSDPDAPPSPYVPLPKTRVHRVEDGAVVAELSDPADPEALPVALAASRDGTVLASAQRDLAAENLSVSIWSMPAGTLVRTFPVPPGLIPVVSASLAISPDGTRVAVATGGGARLFASDGTEVAVIDPAGGSLTFSPDGRYLAMRGAVVDASTGATVTTTSPEDLELFISLNDASAFAFSADSSMLFIGKQPSEVERALFVRAVEGTPALPTFGKGTTTPEPSTVGTDPSYFGISSLAVSPDGELLVSAGFDAQLEAWQTSDGARVRSISGERSGWQTRFAEPERERVASDFQGIIGVLIDGRVEVIVIGGLAAQAHGAAPDDPYLRGAPPGLPFQFDAATIQRGLNFTLTTRLGDVDLLGEMVGGGTYEQVEPHTNTLDVFGREVLVLDLPALIRAKRAAGRPKDLEVIAALEALLVERERRDIGPR